MVTPAAERIVSMLARTWRVCVATSLPTTSRVRGSRGSWPETKMRLPARTAGEYAPAGGGWSPGSWTGVQLIGCLAKVLLHELLHPRDVDRRILAGPVRELHGQAKHRDPSGDIVEAADHVTLAGHRDDRPRAALADHAPR